jgi:transcriptional regulator with XRE-family HTH domain
MKQLLISSSLNAKNLLELSRSNGLPRRLYRGTFRVTKRPNPIDQHVGQRVRVRRLLLGLTQEKVGTALGLTFQQVQKYEKGTNRIGASRLQEISKILDVPPSYFFEGMPEALGLNSTGFADNVPRQYVREALNTTDGLQLNRAFVRIRDAKVRRRIIELVSQIAEADDRRASEPDRELTG